jgi:hypothetical protein
LNALNALNLVGLDIGNATTEAVLVRLGADGPVVLGADRIPTRGPKGGPASIEAAARLVRRLSAAHHLLLDGVVVAPLRPVTTSTVTLPEAAPVAGRLRVFTVGGTAGGEGFAVGRPLPIDDTAATPPTLVNATPLDGASGNEAVVNASAGPVRSAGSGSGSGRGSAGPVVAVVSVGFRAALPRLLELAADDRLAAVVTGRDEAVLIGNRLRAAGIGVPVVDEVPVGSARDADLLAVEVRTPGQPLRVLTDPLRLATALDAPEVVAEAARLAPALFDRSAAVVGLAGGPAAGREPRPAQALLAWGADGEPVTLDDGLLGAAVGTVRAYAVGGQDAVAVDDLFGLDLAAVADAQLARRSALASRTVVLAALRADAAVLDPGAALAELLGVPVRTVSSEAAAARLGALSTPGAPPDALVVDLGAGTIDVISAERIVTLAGAGELLTEGASALLGIGRTTAEWAKRGPSYRVDAPQVLVGEDGSRTFAERPVRADAVGALVVEGPAGWLPFDRGHAPGEWRALRLRLKASVLGGNLARAARTAGAAGIGLTAAGTVIVVGGPAGDDEVLACLARTMPAGTVIARGNAAGTLGHRHSVAFGLVLSY